MSEHHYDVIAIGKFFFFLKHEEEAWVYKTVLEILNFCFVFKIWLFKISCL